MINYLQMQVLHRMVSNKAEICWVIFLSLDSCQRLCSFLILTTGPFATIVWNPKKKPHAYKTLHHATFVTTCRHQRRFHIALWSCYDMSYITDRHITKKTWRYTFYKHTSSKQIWGRGSAGTVWAISQSYLTEPTTSVPFQADFRQCYKGTISVTA